MGRLCASCLSGRGKSRFDITESFGSRAAWAAQLYSVLSVIGPSGTILGTQGSGNPSCTLERLSILHDAPRMPPPMRRSYPIAVLIVLALGLAAVVPSMAGPAAQARRRAHTSATSAKAHPVRRTATRTTARSTTRTPVRSASVPRGRYLGQARLKSATQSGTRARYGAGRASRFRGVTRGSRGRGRFGAEQAQLQAVRLNMPAPLRGSHESLVHQNEMAEADGLERILDDADLQDRIVHGSLVPVPVSGSLRINTDLPENRRYCRPWTAKFLTDLSRAFTGKFAAGSLEVTSAVRTVEYQRRLRMINGNAAAADGDIASPHLTGGTIDIAKQGLSAKEIGWFRAYLIPLEQQGKIDVEEEFRQSCFHISVYKSYTEPKPASREPVTATPMDSASMLSAPGQ